MWQIDLRGDERKRKLLSDYDVHPILAAKVPNVRGVAGCCGPVADEFHIFRATKPAEKEPRYLVMGPGCGKGIYDLLQRKVPKVFSPAIAFSTGQDIPEIYHRLCPFNRELHDSIWLLCLSWRTVPADGLLRILDEIYRAPEKPVPERLARLFFAILRKDQRGRDLEQLAQDVRKFIPELRWLSFENLVAGS